MSTKTRFVHCLTLAASVCAASHIATAASLLTLTDSWTDTGVYYTPLQAYAVETRGSASVNISLPLQGVDLSRADAGTTFLLSIGPAGNPTVIRWATLGHAEHYTAGEKSANFGNLIVSWTATTITVSGRAYEDILGVEQMFADMSIGVATNYTIESSLTSSSIIGAYAEVILTMDASDNGGGVFNYDNPYVPITGSDKETEWLDPDGYYYPLETGSITGTVDFTPPKLTITSPPANLKVYNQNTVIELEGMASDNMGVADIQYFVNGDTNNIMDVDQAAELPANSIAWTVVDLDLSQLGRPGSNVVTVVASDLAGNIASVSRTFLWIETNSAVWTVNPPGAGTIKPNKNGQSLQVGIGISVTAMPASKNWIFSQWTDDVGDILSSNATFEYYDTNNGSLIANFETNYFQTAGLAGTYTGLFFDTNNGAQLDDAGYITLTVTPTGGHSGKLYLASAASPFSFSGQLSEATDDSVARANFTIMVNKSLYLNVSLLVATDPNLTDPGAGMLGGFVNAFSDPTQTNLIDSAQIQGELSLYNPTKIPPGLYNVVISPATSDPSEGPGGWGYGSATVSKKGAVALALNLPDGTSPAMSFSSLVAQDGRCPFYASLYSGNGAILGWMQFATDGSGTMQSQPINWLKLPVADKYYTHGFTAVPAISGGLYLPPKAGTNIFGETALTFTIDAGYTNLSLPDEVDDSVIFNPAKNTFTDTDNVKITLTPTTGALTGTFIPAGAKTALTYHGVVSGGAGYGFYIGANKETGPIWIGTPPEQGGGDRIR